MSEPRPQADQAEARGPLAWMARNSVAANLLMAMLLVGGLMVLPSVKQEVFPEFELDWIQISIAYPGASPSEVEQGVVLAVEEEIRGIEGVKEVRSTAAEGVASIWVELLLGTDPDRALSDVKAAVDRIASLPEDVERPLVSLASNKREVLSLVVYGDQPERQLRALAEQARERLLQKAEITSVELAAVRPLEISIEVPQDTLRRYGLQLQQVADAVRRASIDLPGGSVKTRGGEVLLRTTERRDMGREFEDIVVLGRADGTEVRLGDIATIRDGFRDTDQEAFFDGKRAAMVKVFRVGEEGPLEVSAAVHEFIDAQQGSLPPGVQYAVWGDTSEMYRDRMDLLLRNSYLGLILVLLVLGLFLEVRLAFWVTLGIPVSFIGALLFLPAVDVSINMISLFAFIVSLGMVVDDAIVVGEAIYKNRNDGMPPLRAAIAGVREVAGPVMFSIFTTIIAFMPLLFVPGVSGKFFRNIPLIVITVLLISLVESLLVLPAHLSHRDSPLLSALSWPVRALDSGLRRLVGGRSLLEALERRQQRFSQGVEWFVSHVYAPALDRAVRWRYLTLAVCVAALVLTAGLVAGGRVQFTFLPKIDGDVVRARLEMPVGTPVEVTRRHQQRMLESVRAVLETHGDVAVLSRGIFSEIGGPGARGVGSVSSGATGKGHVADVSLFLVPAASRQVTSSQVAREWRQQVGDVPGAEKLSFDFSTGHSGGAPVSIRLSHTDMDVLERAGADLAAAVREYEGTYDVGDGFAPGKEQLDFKLTRKGRSVGITESDLARQVRNAFYGAEVLRQQRGREEVRVFVRRPLAERRSEHDLEEMLLQTPDGGEVPLSEAARIERGRAYTEIQRANGRRTAEVTAEIDEARANAGVINGGLIRNALPQLMKKYPGLDYEMSGQRQAQADTMQALGRGFTLALIAMFGLLAVAFRSYVQPLMVLLVIPFGMIGAVLGHVAMGYDLSLMTMMGVVALSGVVVNSSLILVVAINRFRDDGRAVLDAVREGSMRRFRPIVLTSLTTFLGLTPMITETSTQARFLIPMAISLGFGVLFAMVLTLVMIPCIYVMLDDIQRLLGRLRASSADEHEESARALVS